MTELYLLCLLVGGGLVALSIAGADGFDADAVEVDPGVEADGEGLTAAARFLSIRNLIFGVAFFGLTGSAFTALGVPGPVTLGSAGVVGLGAAVGLQHLMDYLRSSESGEPASLDRLAGAPAEVVVGLSDAHPGKVSVAAIGQTHQLVARVHEDARVRAFGAGEPVVVVQVDAGVAHVAEPDFLS